MEDGTSSAFSPALTPAGPTCPRGSGRGDRKRRSGEVAVGDEPVLAQVGDGGDALVVAVVVDERQASAPGGGGEQQVRGRDAAMLAGGGQRELGVAGITPDLGRHRRGGKVGEALGELGGPPGVGGKAGQLKDDEVAGEDEAGGDGGVEPIGEMGEAAVADPGPDTGIEKGGSIELERMGPRRGAQDRSRPAATSAGVPSTSRRTSKPASARRAAASRRAALTVSLRPLVPSSRRAASRARSSTSTVVRVISIIVWHLAAAPLGRRWGWACG